MQPAACKFYSNVFILIRFADQFHALIEKLLSNLVILE